MEYYSAISNEVRIHARIQINFENTVNKKPVTNEYILYDYIILKCPNKQIHRERTQLPGAGGERNGERTASGYGVLFWGC